MDANQLRLESINVAGAIGVEIPSTLPLTDVTIRMRDKSDVVARMLAMHAVAASAYGYDRSKVLAWLRQESLVDWLTEEENKFVSSGAEHSDRFKVQVEAIWALAWVMGIVNDFDFTKNCDERFVSQFPNLRQNQSSADFRKRVRPRSLTEIFPALDLAYCLHWAIRQAELSGKRPFAKLTPYVIVERRRALEWLFSNVKWADVLLDT